MKTSPIDIWDSQRPPLNYDDRHLFLINKLQKIEIALPRAETVAFAKKALNSEDPKLIDFIDNIKLQKIEIEKQLSLLREKEEQHD